MVLGLVRGGLPALVLLPFIGLFAWRGLSSLQLVTASNNKRLDDCPSNRRGTGARLH